MNQMKTEPIFMSTLECPVCKTVNHFETIKVGAYIEEGRDTDFCPKNRTWINPNYQRVNPLLYFMATCSACFYTREFNQKYKDWKNDTSFKDYRLKTQKDKHLHKLREENNVVQAMGSDLDGINFPFATAVNKMLLGIYDEKFNLKPSNLDIGRFFLRIAWLFRENTEGPDSNSGQIASHVMNIEDVIQKITHLYNQINDSAGALRIATNDFLSDNLLPESDQKTELSSLYSDALTKMDEWNEAYKDVVVSLKSSMTTSNEIMSTVVSDISPLDQPYNIYSSYRKFLTELKSSWHEVPLSEHEALNLAIHYYKEAYEGGNEIAPGNQAIQAVYLIAELSRRVGNNDEAKSYFNQSIRLAQEFIHQNKGDKSRTALARKILELAIEQGKLNLKTLEK